MFRIVTTIHNPMILATTCRRLNLPTPQQGSIHGDGEEVSGWVIYLPGVRYPIVCDTLTGLIAYDPRDNYFEQYARLMRFVFRYYDIQAQLRQSDHRSNGEKPCGRKSRHPVLAG